MCVFHGPRPIWLQRKAHERPAHGENPAFNPQLAAVIATAKRAAVPKAVIEAAIARGQGRSVSGVTLKSMTLEVMVPPSVALIVEVETDNKNRLLSDLNVVIKRAKGQLSRTTPFFTRWGRVEFEKTEKFRTIEDLMDIGIEAGAWDINDDEDGILTVWTQPDQTTKVGNAIQDKTCLKLVSSELVWSPNKDTIAKIDRGEEAKALSEMLAALREYPDVRAIHANIERGDLAEEEFGELAECLL